MKNILVLSAVALTLGFSATASFAGDAAAGEGDWRNCRSCHSLTDDAGNVIQRGGRTGPNLYGLPGRTLGSVEGFRYGSDIVALGETGVTWTEELFVEYVQDPTAFLREHSGNAGARSRMNYRMRSGAEDMWAYLESVSQ